MKLLFFIHSLDGGGAERVTANLANYWADNGWNIIIVTLAPLSLSSYPLNSTVEHISLGLAGDSQNQLLGLFQNVRRIWALRRVLRQRRPQIALSMMTTANVVLALSACGTGVRSVGSERIHPPQNPLGWAWERLRRSFYGRLDAMTALTSESARWLERETSASLVTVIPNAVTWPLPVSEPEVDPMSVCYPSREVLLAVGRLEPQKGFEQLLSAFAAVAQKHLNWDLVILGEGTLRRKLEAQIRRDGLERRVWLPGRAGNMKAWYDHADLYVLSSRFEGFPNSLSEAMSHGLAAISFDCDTGPRDIIRHGIDGLLVPPGDVPGLISALDRLMGDAEMRERFASRAAEILERFSMRRISGIWQQLFERLVNDKPRK